MWQGSKAAVMGVTIASMSVDIPRIAIKMRVTDVTTGSSGAPYHASTAVYAHEGPGAELADNCQGDEMQP